MFNLSDIDMTSIDITDEKINNLLREMEKIETPIERKTPEMIEKNPNKLEREKELSQFTLLHNLYIAPLSELSKRICTKMGLPYSEIPSFSNLSIMGRMSKLRDFLLSKGCTINTIMQLVPKTTQEIQLLARANKCGFNLAYNGIIDLTNNNRIERAKNYLVSYFPEDISSNDFKK